MPETKERVNAITLGQFLKRQRRLRGFSQAEVAERMGRKQGQIARLETGMVSTVPLAEVAAYAKAVGTTEKAALRALGHPSLPTLPSDDTTDEEATALAEAYRTFQTDEARNVLRHAFLYADAIERGITQHELSAK